MWLTPQRLNFSDVCSLSGLTSGAQPQRLFWRVGCKPMLAGSSPGRLSLALLANALFQHAAYYDDDKKSQPDSEASKPDPHYVLRLCPLAFRKQLDRATDPNCQEAEPDQEETTRRSAPDSVSMS